MSWLATILLAATTFSALQSLSQGRYFNKDTSSWKTPFNVDDFLSDTPLRDDTSAFYSWVLYPVKGSRTKRMLFDSNCKGIYNRRMIDKLDVVCDACYNLYRKPYIASGCRKHCFNNGVFESCLYDLMMHDVAEDYTSMVKVVGK